MTRKENNSSHEIVPEMYEKYKCKANGLAAAPLIRLLALEEDAPPDQNRPMNGGDMQEANLAGKSGKSRPFDGWALEAARELERRASVPIVSRLFCASDLRRGAAFLALAAWCAPHPEQRIILADVTEAEFAGWLFLEDPAEIAEVLDNRRSDPRSLALFGQEPLARPEQYRNPFI
ncbi:hypothetical protein [Cereibacter sediminicola]|uniref:hypothetical protein n=1 Tax=Cereibacter sediminicola TaxID=2584941 RepID=UPI001FEB9B2A|nr:hypothetical protein [Cereibacter sediminicola]